MDMFTRNNGKYVIVRGCTSGINAGYVVEQNQYGIVLSQARRLWYHKPKDGGTSWYEGVALSGLDKSSILSPVVSEKVIVEEYEVLLCTKEAEDSITQAKPHPQSGQAD